MPINIQSQPYSLQHTRAEYGKAKKNTQDLERSPTSTSRIARRQKATEHLILALSAIHLISVYLTGLVLDLDPMVLGEMPRGYPQLRVGSESNVAGCESDADIEQYRSQSQSIS